MVASALDLTKTPIKESHMSSWLSARLRRIIAVLLLVLDLGLEPGSALSFVGMAGPDEGEAIADLCKQDDFWWGRTRAAIDEATRPVRSAISSDDGGRQSASSAESARIQGAVILANVAAVFDATWFDFERVPSELGLPLLDERSLHRNTYIAQKRDIVLIV